MFGTALGSGVGRWHGTEIKVDEEVDVEFDIDTDLVWGSNCLSWGGDNFISHNNETVEIGLTVQKVEDDGTLICKFGSSLIMIEVSGVLPNDIEHIRCYEVSVHLWPTNL